MATFTSNGTPITQPSPQYDLPIVSNNGVLKARRQSGLPLGYTLLEYIQSTGTQYIDTGVILNSEATITTVAQANSFTGAGPFAFWGFMGAGTVPRWGWSIYSDKWLSDLNNTRPMSAADAQKHTFVNTCYYVNDNLYYDGFVDGNSIYTSAQTAQNIALYASNTLSAYLFARNNNNTAGNFLSCRIFSYEIVQDGVKILNLVPCRRNSDSELGMYDLVSGQFFTNQGTGDFVAGTAVSDPVEIYTDGTVETIEDTIGNTATAEMLLKVGDYQDVQSIIDGVVNRQLGVFVLDGTEGWAYSAGYSDTATNACFYIPQTSTSPILPQSATTVECLCSHFRWVSRNEVYANKTPIVGAITGSGTSARIGTSITLRVPLSVAGTTPNNFNQWLADQYNAGTPVIIVYPLATPTTESVTGQALQVQAGDNTVEITQAGMDGLELEVEYEKEVE